MSQALQRSAACLDPLAQWGHVYAASAYMCCHRANGMEKIGVSQKNVKNKPKCHFSAIKRLFPKI